jgi:carbamoyltransferase
MATTPTYVLGTGLSHDGSACLLKDGRIAVAIEKERLTRVKHDGGNDTAAIEYCLAAEGIDLEDVTLVVQGALHSMFRHGNTWFRGPRLFSEACPIPIVSISHHLAHAYGAFYSSPFDEAAVLVIDGSGSSYDDCFDRDGAIVPVSPAREVEHGYFEKDSYYLFQDGRCRACYKDFSPWGYDLKEGFLDSVGTLHSIGGLYWAASIYCFRSFSDAGKLMGLAPYGRDDVYDEPIFDLRDGRAFLTYEWTRRMNRPVRAFEAFKENFQYYADFARWIQRETERAILYIVQERYRLAPSRNLVYCGGVALNAVANRRILREGPFEQVYIQPSAGDNGVALGCAFYGWIELLKRQRVRHDGGTCFGRPYAPREIAGALAGVRDRVEIHEVDEIAAVTADLLAQGKVVGWFQGGAEFGPRALGNRSILASPGIPGLRDFINAKVKDREDFRPFAPAVLEHRAREFFEIDAASPYMILVGRVKPEHRDALSEVTHVDGSARVQTVSEAMSPRFFALLKAYEARTGRPVLLNTSLNKRGMPIVETPAEALELLLSTELDALVIEQCVVTKKERPIALDLRTPAALDTRTR